MATTFGPYVPPTDGIQLSGSLQPNAPAPAPATNPTYDSGSIFLPNGTAGVLGASTTASNSGGSTGGTAAGAGSASDIATYQDQINSLNQLLNNTDVIKQNKMNSINQNFDNSLNQLTGNNQNVLNQYNTQKTNTQNDYSKNIDHINSNARQGYNSLQALLGGTGSAGNVLAPFAVSQQANQQRGVSADAFAKNLKGINEGVAAAQQNYTNQKKSLEGQKNSSLQDLLSSIDQQKIAYQQQLAQAQNQLRIAQGGSYATPTANNNAIADLISQQNNLSSQLPTPNFSVQDYVAPQLDLAQYQAQAAQLAGTNNDPSTSPTDDAASALAALLKQNQTTNAYSY